MSIQSIIKDYRKLLLQHEITAEKALISAHQTALRAIQPRLDNLYTQIAEKQKAGETIPVSWLYEQKRLETTKALISGQIDHYAALARMQTNQLQRLGVQLGSASAQAQLEATLPRGVSFSFGVPSQDALESIVGATQSGSPLADLFKGFGSEAATEASDALVRGILLGQNPREIAGEVEQALDIPRWRALTIARTEMLRAYREAAIANYKANDDVVDKWVWVAALDTRTCAACIAMHGTEHNLSEDLDGHPNCRCSKSPKTKSWDDILGALGIDTSNIRETSFSPQSGLDWFSDQDEATQRAILGNSKYEAYQNGDFELSDVVKKNHDPDWGTSVSEKPLKDLV